MAALRADPLPAVPAFADVRAAHRPSDVRLLDRSGAVVHETRVDASVRRLDWAPLDAVSPALAAAVIASEDRRFYDHAGVDWWAVAAALWSRVTGGPSRGASTITMQVGASLDTALARRGAPRSLAQKWRQIRLATVLERRWSKQEILEAYLNRVTFRGELDGVAAVSAVLFDKAPHGLTAAEAVVLAALIRGPNAGAEAVTRRAGLLREALDPETAGSVDEGALAAAVTRALDAPRGSGPRVADAPHLARSVLAGAAPHAAVATTLDGGLQRLAAESLRRHLLAVRDRSVTDGAVLIADNATGDVLAYVGGAGDLASARHVDGIRARRQAGSALKPFLYGLAFERRLLTPASLLEDTPLEVAVQGGVYRPRNYDEAFRGLVSARTALASSLNVPAVRALDLVGTERLVERLRDLGFEGLVESGDWYGPSLALGSADVTLWDLVNAYRTLAQGGLASPLRIVPGDSAPARRVMPAAAAFLVADVLADRASRSATFGLENPLATRFWTAVKTGTSKDMRDNWCVGFSRRYTVGVWVGNFSGEPMRDVSGVTGAAPVWLEVMAALHRGVPSDRPTPPPGVVAARATFERSVEPPRREWFLAGTEPVAVPASRAVAALPRIVRPVAGTIVALDPDIPPDRQRMVFEATAAAGLRWVLDGADAGPAAAPLAWEPRAGAHALVLAGADGRPVDTVRFVVRGEDRVGAGE